jgi:RNA polymerase sigma-70 factor (ECF subfamily)
LTEEQRATFVMADLTELSAPEIAAVLDANLNTVYSRLRSARQTVSRLLKGEPHEQAAKTTRWS